MEQRRSLKLAIPPQTSDEVSFFDGSAADFDRWVDALPVARPVQTAKALHDALAEANRCRTRFTTRFAQLEILRPFVHASCSAMTRRRRDTPLLVDARARAEAALAQRTQYQLATGYKIVIVEALRNKVPLAPGAASDSDAGLTVVAIHRAMAELGHTLLRSLQYYTPPPGKLWEQMHSLFSLAESRRVLDEPVADSEHSLGSASSLSDVYERALLLATAQPNKLRQGDLGKLFTALEDWSRLVTVVPLASLPSPIMVVDLAGAGPPVSASQHFGEGVLRTLDARRLTEALEVYLAGDMSAPHPDLAMVDPDNLDLVRHCAQVWGAVTDRAHVRTVMTGSVEVCTSLSHVHFHAGGGRSLLRQMQSERIEEEAADDDEVLDPFAGASDLGGVRNLDDARVARRFISSEQAESEAEHPLYRLDLADVSPVGFGLLCEGEVPPNLQAGQIMGVREAEDPDWRVTLVRWVANGPKRSRLGVETLAQRALSGGARIVSSRARDLDFTRALLLPGIEALNKSPILITVPGSFTPGQKIAFTQGGRETKLLIEQRLSFAESFEQFEVRELVTTASIDQDTGIEVEIMSEEEELAALEAFGRMRNETSPPGD